MSLWLVLALLQTPADREAAMFGDAPETTADAEVEARLQEAHDKLAIGGKLYLRLEYFLSKAEDPLEDTLASPNLLDLYLDARPTERVRAFAQARMRHDFTVDESEVDPLTGRSREQTSVDLDQLWLKFDVGRQLYVTAGQQRIKWGANRFWNPTDFLNQQRLNPLDIFDQRLGVPLLKLHLPVESLGWNFYAIGLFDGANSPEDVGGALRGEFVAGTAEVSLSAAARKDLPIKLGADASVGVWDLDLRTEVAVSRGKARRWSGDYDVLPALGAAALPEGSAERNQLELAAPLLGWTLSPELEDRDEDWILQAVVGFEWGVRVGDEDTLYVTGEYFYNGNGVDDPALYPWMQLQGDFQPLYVGEHYAAAALLLPAPGQWDDTTFSLGGIANLSDQSGLLRFDYSVRVLTRLQVNLFVAGHLGEGELSYGIDEPGLLTTDQLDDFAMGGTVDPALAELIVDGVEVPGPLIDVGVWLSVDL